MDGARGHTCRRLTSLLKGRLVSSLIAQLISEPFIFCAGCWLFNTTSVNMFPQHYAN